jgi:hypothetical protein
MSPAGALIALLLPEFVDLVAGVDPFKHADGVELADDGCVQQLIALLVLTFQHGRFAEQGFELIAWVILQFRRRHALSSFLCGEAARGHRMMKFQICVHSGRSEPTLQQLRSVSCTVL